MPQTPAIPQTTKEIDDHFDPQPYPARIRALAELARALPESAYRTLHAALTAGDPTHHHTALHLAAARRDTAAIEEVLRGTPEPALRRRALSVADRLGLPDRVFEDLIPDAPRNVRRDVYGILRRSRRRAAADRLVPMVAERHGDADVAALLPACSPGVVADWLTRVEPPPDAWPALARLAPRAVLDLLVRRLTGNSDRALWRVRNQIPEAALITIAGREPLAVLADEIAWDLFRGSPEPMRALAAHAPAATFDRIRVRPDPYSKVEIDRVRATPQVAAALAALTDEQAAAVVRNATARPDERSALHLFPVDRRLRIVEAADTEYEQELRGAVYAALPPGERVPVVERLLATLDPERDADEYRELWSVLPLARARKRLAAETADHRHQVRVEAWPALISCAVREGDPAEFGAVLAGAGRAWHDRDEVRQAALSAIRAAPERLLAAVPAAALHDAAVGTVQARDRSRGSGEELADWVLRTLVRAARDGDVARLAALLPSVLSVLADRRLPAAHRTLRGLPIAAIRTVWAGAHDALLTHADRGRFTPTLHLAGLLRPHLGALPEADALLDRAAREAEEFATRSAAAVLWVRAGERDARVAEVLCREPEFAAVPAIAELLLTRRTDLLDEVEYVRRLPRLPRPSVAGRWTPGQRALRAEALARVTGDPDAELWDRVAATEELTDPVLLRTLVEGEPTQPIRVAAVSAYGRAAPAAESLPVLLRVAGVGSGVVAGAAVRACRAVLGEVADADIPAALGSVLRSAEASVGARKEAVRLVSALAPRGAIGVLREVWEQPDLHRDVRVAAVAGLATLAEHPEVAPLLVAAFAGDPAVREAIVLIGPKDVPRRAQPALARVVSTVLAGPAGPARSAAMQAYQRWWREDPDGFASVGAIMADLTGPDWSPATARLAIRWLVEAHETRTARAALRRATARLVELSGAPDVVVAARAHGQLVALAGWCGPWRDTPRELFRPVVDALRAAGLAGAALVPLYALAVSRLADGDPALDLWDELIAVVDERPGRWTHMPASSRHHLKPGPALAELCAHLHRAPGTIPGLLAIRLLRAAAEDTDRAALLPEWLTHPDPDVREAAYAALPD
ncbi:hypothetical protein [Embleya sp. AB8]|uniref:hypothetical protein n=1 Tax=Embleya sp. AB8 TaxID=3156304 RepID=UPI003C72C8CF